jgi:hypothetical protein
MSKITAQTLAYSSVVGGGVLLFDDTGQVIGQLMLRGLKPSDANRPNTAEQWEKDKAEYVAFCDRIATAINAGQPEHQVRHYKRAEPYDVVASEALFQVSDEDEGLPVACGRIVTDGAKVVVYRNPQGMHFVRFPDEMIEPRFKVVV